MKAKHAVLIGALGMGFLLAVPAFAGAIKTWASGEILRAADLNSNFTHIHNSMVGGHGARLVDADVSASALIAHSKLATPALVPRAWAKVGSGTTACAAGACTLAASSKVTGVAWSATGVYDVTLAYTPTNLNFSVWVTAGPATGANKVFCQTSGTATATPHVSVACYTDAGAANDAVFNILVMDND